MKKPISFLFTISLLLLALCTLISCVPTAPAPEEHTHEYKNEYAFDDTFHWKACIDSNCEEIAQKEEHTLLLNKCLCGYIDHSGDDENPEDEKNEEALDSGLQFVLCQNSYYKVAGIGDYKGTNVTVPATYKNLPVTTIGVSAFENEPIRSITLPESITTIEDRAFFRCQLLTTITVPEDAQLQTIGESAFFDCTALSAFTISGSIVSIGDYAFSACDVFTNLTLPQDLAYVGFGAFEGCNSITKVTLPYIGPTREYDEDKSYFGYIFGAANPNHQEIILPERLTEVVVYGELTSIPKTSFLNCVHLKKISIPKTTTEIGAGAFSGCISLEGFELPGTITSIGSAAFYECLSLAYINSPPLSLVSIEDYTFYKCYALDNVVLPETLVSIGQSAFWGCRSLKEIVFPHSVREIKGYAFGACTSLTEILIHETLEKIQPLAFSNCTSLRTVYWNAIDAQSDSYGEIFLECSSLEALYIDEDVTTLPNVSAPSWTTIYWNARSCTFSGSTYYGYIAYSEALTTVIFGENVMTLPETLLRYCTALENVTLPPQLKVLSEGIFDGCASLSSITLPEKLEEIGQGAFYNCKKLASATLPSTIKKIGAYAFYACELIESIEIPEDLTSIGEGAFYDCKNLTSVTWLARACADNESAVFSHLYLDDETKETLLSTSLTSITFGENVERIPAYVFSQCIKVNKLNIPDSVTYIGERAFQYCVGISDFYLSQNVTSIGDYAFEQCLKIENLSLSNTLTSLGVGAFCDCQSLKTLQLPSSLTSIAGFAVDGCKSLLEINIPEGIVTLERDAFARCESVQKLTLPSTLKQIEYSAFSGCQALTEVDIPHGVTKIDDCAFAECEKLTSILIPTTVQYIGTIESDIYYVPDRIIFCKGNEASFSNTAAITDDTTHWKQNAYFYSETKPEESGNYWHYDADGNPVVWEFENL